MFEFRRLGPRFGTCSLELSVAICEGSAGIGGASSFTDCRDLLLRRLVDLAEPPILPSARVDMLSVERVRIDASENR